MTKIDCIEDEIKVWLGDIYPDKIQVIQSPENESEFESPKEKPKISVVYSHTKFEGQRSTGSVVQDEWLHVDVVIQSRTLREKLGIYDLYNEVRRRLHGRQSKLTGDKYQSVSFEPFSNRDEDFWTYVYQVRMKSMAVEAENCFEEYPILKSVNYEFE